MINGQMGMEINVSFWDLKKFCQGFLIGVILKADILLDYFATRPIFFRDMNVAFATLWWQI